MSFDIVLMEQGFRFIPRFVTLSSVESTVDAHSQKAEHAAYKGSALASIRCVVRLYILQRRPSLMLLIVQAKGADFSLLSSAFTMPLCFRHGGASGLYQY